VIFPQGLKNIISALQAGKLRTYSKKICQRSESQSHADNKEVLSSLCVQAMPHLHKMVPSVITSLHKPRLWPTLKKKKN